MKRKIPRWLYVSFVSLLLNGAWGALIEIPEKRMSPPFPTTLGYVVWSFIYLVAALYMLYTVKWDLQYDLKTIVKSLFVGALGAGGQFLLFDALRTGPAYIIFPIVSIYPLVTVVLSLLLLKEKAGWLTWLGVVTAINAIILLSLQEPGANHSNGNVWLWLTFFTFLMWGLQSFFAKAYLRTIKLETVFFYMGLSNIFFVPLAVSSTDYSVQIGWQSAFYVSMVIQFLNAVGSLTAFSALKYGKAIIVVPVTGLAPMITTIVSLIIYLKKPYVYNAYGIILAMVSLGLITYAELQVQANADKKAQLNMG